MHTCGDRFLSDNSNLNWAHHHWKSCSDIRALGSNPENYGFFISSIVSTGIAQWLERQSSYWRVTVPGVYVKVFLSKMDRAFTWGIEREVQSPLTKVQIPNDCLPGKLINSCAIQSWVLQWGHGSQLSCHPGVSYTISLLSQGFWWLSLWEDAREHVSACSVYACSKGSHSPPAGLLRPLPVPQHPWAHIFFDFVAFLPHSEVTLTIIASFLKRLTLLLYLGRGFGSYVSVFTVSCVLLPVFPPL